MNRVGDRLGAALMRDARANGIVMRCSMTTRPWCASLFDGLVAELTLEAAPSPARTAWLAALPDAELPIAGWCVADLAVDRVDDAGALLSILLIARD